MIRHIIKRELCGVLKPLGRFIGGDPYCKRCANKVPPLAKILAVSRDGTCARCDEQGVTVFHAEFGSDFSDAYCMECLSNDIGELPPLPNRVNGREP